MKKDFKLDKAFCYKLKSLADFVVAFVCIIVFSPVFLVVSIFVKFDSRGPVFFLQRRIGKNGKEFKIIKFRSMSIDSPHDLPTKQFKDRERHFTRAGKTMRQTGLDELPQLFNILLGQMSFVGPRPSHFKEAEQISLRKKFNLTSIKPGLTGWAQVKANGLVSAKKKIALDLYYFENFSFALDAKIIYITIRLVMRNGQR